MTGAQKKKNDAYKLMDSQKTHEYEVTGAQKTDENEITDALNPCVQTKKVENPCVKTVHVSECERMTELKSITTIREKRACQDVDVKPVVRDSLDDDRVLVESGAEMTPVPHEPFRV